VNLKAIHPKIYLKDHCFIHLFEPNFSAIRCGLPEHSNATPEFSSSANAALVNDKHPILTAKAIVAIRK